MTLESKLLVSSTKIDVDICGCVAVGADLVTMIVTKQGNPNPSFMYLGDRAAEFIKRLENGDGVLFVSEGRKIKLAYGPLDENSFYFLQGNPKTKSGDGAIAYSSSVEVRLENVASFAVMPPTLMIIRPKVEELRFRTINFYEDSAIEFVKRFREGNRIITIKENDKNVAVYGPIDENKLYISKH